jgi:hypothetical protein
LSRRSTRFRYSRTRPLPDTYGGLKVAFQSRADLGERQEARPRPTGYKTAARLLEPEGFTAFRLRRLDAPRLAFLDDIRD